MLPVIALVGRPNVGKSTLFNVLTRSRDALVADIPGLTRDRQYGQGKLGSRPYLVVDTGGLTDEDGLQDLVTRQALQAVDEADALLLLVDGRAGLNAADEEVASRLRRRGKRLFLVLNKTEHLDLVSASAEFHALGLGPPIAISASHQRGIGALLEQVLGEIPGTPELEADDDPAENGGRALRLAVVGRPNVGKSTLVNRLLGEQRMLAFDQPGTTRDSVAVPFERDGKAYVLIDTAGVRRRSRVSETIEKFSVIKTLQSMQQAHVVMLMLDARQGIAEQDATLIGYVLDSGRALVIAVNKWDRLPSDTRGTIRSELGRKLKFLDFAEFHFISALHGTGVIDVLDAVDRAYQSATRDLSTPELTRILEQTVERHQPPLVHGHSVKLRYAHQGGRNPPVIVIHGSRTQQVPDSYRRYLANTFRQRLKMRGTPIRIELKSGDNPYQPGKPKAHHRNRPLDKKHRSRRGSKT